MGTFKDVSLDAFKIRMKGYVISFRNVHSRYCWVFNCLISAEAFDVESTDGKCLTRAYLMMLNVSFT